MKNILLKLSLFVFFVTSTSYAEVISKIDISGNKRISNESIKVLGNVGD